MILILELDVCMNGIRVCVYPPRSSPSLMIKEVPSFFHSRYLAVYCLNIIELWSFAFSPL